MIDASKSPVPAWKRYLMIAVVAALIVVAAYTIYTKELHKGSGSSAAAKPPAAAPAPAASPSGTAQVHKAPVSTTVPGGVPESDRNPFGA